MKESGFIQEQARKLYDKLRQPPGQTREERTPDEIINSLISFLKDRGPKQLEEIAKGVGIQEQRAERAMEWMVREGLAKRDYKLTEKGKEFARMVEEIQSLPEPE